MGRRLGGLAPIQTRSRQDGRSSTYQNFYIRRVRKVQFSRFGCDQYHKSNIALPMGEIRLGNSSLEAQRGPERKCRCLGIDARAVDVVELMIQNLATEAHPVAQLLAHTGAEQIAVVIAK